LIPVDNRQRRVAVHAAEVRAVVQAAFERERAGEPCVAVSVVDDAAIRAVNARWLGHDHATDAIAFSYEDDPGPDGVRGEVLVSAETARREALARGGEPRDELLLYVAHGTLHLLGWDDDTPARRRAMNSRARSILRAARGAARGARRARPR
jgi:probable rRNA maturation factor